MAAEKTVKIKISENGINETPAEGNKEEKTVTVSYKIEELAANAKQLFGVPNECVVAACMLAGIKQATEPEAKKIVSDFMNKEVL